MSFQKKYGELFGGTADARRTQAGRFLLLSSLDNAVCVAEGFVDASDAGDARSANRFDGFAMAEFDRALTPPHESHVSLLSLGGIFFLLLELCCFFVFVSISILLAKCNIFLTKSFLEGDFYSLQFPTMAIQNRRAKIGSNDLEESKSFFFCFSKKKEV